MASGQDDDAGIDFELYRYTPSLVAAVIFIVLFVITTALHTYQVIRAHCYYFVVFIVGGVFQIIGYVCRALAHDDKESIPLYSCGTILILLGPTLFAASIYMTLGRLIRHLDAERLSLVSVKWLTKVFVTGDVVAFFAQGAGGGIMASGTASAMELGENITIAGLCVQLIFFSVFIVVSTIFHRRIFKAPTQRSLAASMPFWRWPNITWEGVMLGLYVSSVLILIRSIFRLIEYAQGNDGYLISHEAFMYVFDSMLMFFTMVAMNVYHPCDVLSPSQKTRVMSGESRLTQMELRQIASK